MKMNIQRTDSSIETQKKSQCWSKVPDTWLHDFVEYERNKGPFTLSL